MSEAKSEVVRKACDVWLSKLNLLPASARAKHMENKKQIEVLRSYYVVIPIYDQETIEEAKMMGVTAIQLAHTVGLEWYCGHPELLIVLPNWKAAGEVVNAIGKAIWEGRVDLQAHLTDSKTKDKPIDLSAATGMANMKPFLLHSVSNPCDMIDFDQSLAPITKQLGLPKPRMIQLIWQNDDGSYPNEEHPNDNQPFF
jgi:hypothetical protein